LSLHREKTLPVPSVEQIRVKILPLMDPAANFFARKLEKSRGIGVYVRKLEWL